MISLNISKRLSVNQHLQKKILCLRQNQNILTENIYNQNLRLQSLQVFTRNETSFNIPM